MCEALKSFLSLNDLINSASDNDDPPAVREAKPSKGSSPGEPKFKEVTPLL